MTRKQFDERLSYDVLGNGYDIYEYDVLWFSQREPYAKVYVPNGTYEENAIAHCEDIVKPAPPVPPSPEEVNRADIDFMALMLNIELPSEEEQKEEE